MAAKTLYLIDGHAQIYRAYYAPFGNLSSPTGEPTRAVHVFTQMLLNLLRDRKPDYLVMTLDVDDRTVFRTQIDPDYKGNRDASPEDMGPQIERIISIVQSMGIPILQLSGYEADDLMATIARRHAGTDLDVFLVSRDKDLDQLLNDHVFMYDPMKDEVITEASMRAAKGFGPDKAIEAQMLMGDSTDNIKGANGVGPKKAAQLLEKYGSVAAIIDAADELTPKLRENILEFKERADVVRQLVTLKTDVEFEFDLAAAVSDTFEIKNAVPILNELGLRRLVERLSGEADADAPRAAVDSEKQSSKKSAPASQTRSNTGFLFGDPDDDSGLTGGAGTFDASDVNYELIDSKAAFSAFVKKLKKQKAFAFDTETTGLNPADAELCGISISWNAGTGYYIPVRGIGKTLDEVLVRDALTPIFADETIAKRGQNLKYDVFILRAFGMNVRGIDFDTMIAGAIALSDRRSHGIDAMARDLLGYTKIETHELLGKGKNQITFADVETTRTVNYAVEDADIAWRLYELLEKKITGSAGETLFREVEMPLVDVLAKMEQRGVGLDVDVLAEISNSIADRLVKLEKDIHAEAGHPFNINSTKQLGEILFDELGLRVVKRTKTTRSTDAEVLETLATEAATPLPGLVLEYRELSKLKSTYVDALPEMVSNRTGRIHPSFHQIGAITGRLSCSDPNLQNIPIRTELGSRIRRAFVPSDDQTVLIKADYSQIELRVLAHFSGDKALRDAFENDRDIHATVAAQLAGIDIEDVTKEQRARAKTVNFGIVYGQTAFGLARSTGMSQAEARDFIEAYFKTYPTIRAFLDSCVDHARQHGFVETILGRRREIRDIDSRNRTAKQQAERFAANTVIQGSAADMIKAAMVKLDRQIEAEQRPSKMLIQVHDELVFECPKKALKKEVAMIVDCMASAIPLDVPVKVDVAAGANWLDGETVG